MSQVLTSNDVGWSDELASWKKTLRGDTLKVPIQVGAKYARRCEGEW